MFVNNAITAQILDLSETYFETMINITLGVFIKNYPIPTLCIIDINFYQTIINLIVLTTLY